MVKGCTPQELGWVCMQGLGLKQTQGVVPVKGHTQRAHTSSGVTGPWLWAA